MPRTRRHRLIFASIILLCLAACGKAPQGAGMGGFPPPEVVALTVSARDVPIDFEYVGQSAGSREVEIRARVTGIVDKRFFEEGSQVWAGQPLFRLDAAAYAADVAAADADVATAEARVKQAEREYARLKNLVEAKAESQKVLDDASANRDLAAAGLKAAKARLSRTKIDLAYTRIDAPISGTIGKALKVEGSLVSAPGDSLLATMAQVHPIYVNFSIPENEQARIQQEAAAGQLRLPKQGFVVQVKTADGRVLPRKGRLNFSDYQADASTGSYPARAELANADHALSPGQFLRVLLSGAARPQAIALPQTAVLDGPMGKFVYLLGKGKNGMVVAEPRPVVLGEWVRLDGDTKNAWIVKQGLQPGDQVIVEGLAKIMMPGMPVKPVAPSHAPAQH